MNIKTHIDRTISFVQQNYLYLLIWATALATVIVLNASTKNALTFVGVTESKEVNINSRNSVVIQKVHVLPGQFVKKGQLLIELERPDLTRQINEVEHKLKEAVSQYKVNEKLNNELNSIKSSLGKDSKEEDPISIQIKSLELELKHLQQGKEGLYIFAQFDGHIGEVNFKQGESVSPFESIATIHKTTPSLVRGYIHEKNLSEVGINKKVIITSSSRKKKFASAVTSVGTRIVELPERFKRNPNEKVWGREVIVKIPEDNGFLLGEKVFLEVDDRSRSISTLVDTKKKNTEKVEGTYQKMTSVPADRHIEPSGVLFVEQLNKVLMISDDNIDHQGLIYLVNRNGEFDSHIIQVEGIDSINDMESISADENGNIYLLASQSKNKHGRVKKSRQKFVKVARNGMNFAKEGEILLLTELQKIAKKFKHDYWVRLLRKKKGKIELDIEGLVVSDNTAYLGLRNPVKSSKEVIMLKIKELDRLFASGELSRDQVSVWKTIKLPVKRRSDRNEGISDLMLLNNQLIIVTANNGHKQRGRVLVTSLDEGGLVKEIAYFKDKKPEGVTYLSGEKQLLIVFDDNNRTDELFFAKLSWE